MKVAELLRESSYLKEMGTHILDLLVAFRANRIGEIDFDKFLKDIQAAGYDIDADFLADRLGRVSWVQHVDPEHNKIILKVSDADEDEETPDEPAAEQPDKAEANVEKKAKQVADKLVKD